MSFEATKAVIERSRAEGGTRLVLFVLAFHANKDKSHISWPSVPTIARETRLSERQVQRCLRSAAASGELFINLQTGRSHQNQYGFNLPGLPVPPFSAVNGTPTHARKGDTSVTLCSPPKGVIRAAQEVTSETIKGDTHDTQTNGTTIQNAISPSSPPEGDGEVSHSYFWLRGLAEHFGIKPEDVSERDRSKLEKFDLPPREELKILLQYLLAPAPAPFANDEEAQLLKCRKMKLGTIIRHFPEMHANARKFGDRHRASRHPSPCHKPKLIPEPADTENWRQAGIELYTLDGPEMEGRNQHVSEKFRTKPWCEIERSQQEDIILRIKGRV